MFTKAIPAIKKGAGIFATGVLTKWGENTGQVLWDAGKSRFFPPPSAKPIEPPPAPPSATAPEVKSAYQPPTVRAR